MNVDEQLHAPGRLPRQLVLGRAITVLDGGNHHPLLCELEADGKPAGSWVVKPQDVLSTGNIRPGPLNVVAELASAEVCGWAGLRTPATGLLRFPPKPIDRYVASVPDAWRAEVATVFEMNQDRLAFCCQHLQGAIDIDPDTLKGPRGKAATQKWGSTLFAVDAYLRHDDRRRGNPNAVFWLNDEVVAIDNGATFAGMDRPGTRGADLARYVVLHGSNSLREHVFFEPLRRFGSGADWQRVGRRLAEVSDEAIDRAASGWPDELNPWKAQVVAFLKTRREVAFEIMEQAASLFTMAKPMEKPHAAG